MGRKLRVAIVGTGNIGTDLLVKVSRSPSLECGLFAGRNLRSAGMERAAQLGVPVSDKGIEAIADDPDRCDLVFECTSAQARIENAPILRRLGKIVVDLTPSELGLMCVPAINAEASLLEREINMVTCGGQVAIPIAHAIGAVHGDVEYLEVVSSIASRSAGPATRRNLDEYIGMTEHGLARFSGARRTKAILILNPAQPCVHMQTTVFARVGEPKMGELETAVARVVERIRGYVPGYRLVVPPVLQDGRIVVTARVSGLGDYLPEYAGNLDIINCAALAAAEGYARARAATPPVREVLHA